MASPGSLCLAGLAAVACALGACAGAEPPYFFATVTADWPVAIDDPSRLGYWVTVTVTKKLDRDGDCETVSPDTRVLVEGTEASFVPDSAVGCARAELQLGPFLREKPIAIVVEHQGEVAATATFAGLFPGTAAVLVSPADGLVRAGDDIVVRPVPEVPTAHGSAHFFPLDQPDGKVGAVYGSSERLLDGLHVAAPAFPGRAWLVIRGDGSADAAVSCAGFAICIGQAAVTLGPFLVTEVP